MPVLAALTMNKDARNFCDVYGNATGIFFLGSFLFEARSNIYA
jgi:hypothetical protein